MPYNLTGTDARDFFTTGVTSDHVITTAATTVAPTYTTYTRWQLYDFDIEDGYLLVRNPYNNELLGKIKMIVPGQVNESELIDILEK